MIRPENHPEVVVQDPSYGPTPSTPPFTDRRHPEPATAWPSAYRIDSRRIIECTAFRRLEQKTQVFAPAHHDHFRTRMTHTLEASHIARRLAGLLGANEDLTEAITLAHDLGHPPFGHAGEAALNDIAREAGGFNHNVHTLRVVEYLEHPFPSFRGLNLTSATLEGLARHATRYDVPDSLACGGGDPPREGPRPLMGWESQIASLADRIAYNSHDLEDAIGAGFVQTQDVALLELWRDACTQTPHRDLPLHSIRRLVLNNIVDSSMEDVAACVTRSVLDPKATPAFSPGREQAFVQLERFLLDRVYRHHEIEAMDQQGKSMIDWLYASYRRDLGALPERFQRRVASQGVDRVIIDYIAGMTDRFCRREFARMGGACDSLVEDGIPPPQGPSSS